MRETSSYRVFLCTAIICTTLLSCSQKQENYSTFEDADEVFSSYKSILFTDADSAIALLRERQAETSDSTMWYYWETMIGRCHFFCYQEDSTEQICRKVNRYCREHAGDNVTYLDAVNENMMGIIHQGLNHRDSARFYFTQAYFLMAKTPLRKELSNICINIGDVSRQLGKYPQAIRWLRRSLFLADSLGLETQKNAICVSIGQIYTDLRNFMMSERYFDMAENSYPPNNRYETFNLYNSRGNDCYFAKKYSEALGYFWKADDALRDLQNPAWKVIVDINLGECHLYLGECDSAHFYIDKAYQFITTTPNPDDSYIFYVNGLKAALALEEGNLKEASYYLNQPYDPARISANYQHTLNKRMMDFYKKKSDYKSAMKYADIVASYEDSLRNIQQINAVTEIESRYIRDTAILHKNLEIAGNHQKISKQRSTIMAFAVLALILGSCALWGILYYRRRKTRQLKEQADKIALLRIENSQKLLSPHFIFNVLNSIFPALRENETIGKSLSLLVKVLRTNMMISGKLSITLEEEIGLARNYADLRCGINPAAPKVNWNISPLVDRSLMVPTMIIQNNVENAIKHAFPPSFQCEGEKHIDISIEPYEAFCVRVIIRDNGIGFKQSASVKSGAGASSTDTGNGIKILTQTIKILNAKNSEHIVYTMEEDHGTVVTICIPSNFSYKL